MDHGLDLTSQAETTHFWFRGFRQFVGPVLADVAAGRPNLRLLDCGCGTGFNLNLLVPHGRAFGFDLARSGVARARAQGRSVARGDITRIPFATATFDIATSFDVLQCVPDDEAGVREMARVIKPGGSIVLTLAALDFLRGDHAIAWQEFRRYTPSLARRLVEGAGLETVRVSFMFASVFPVILGARLMQRLLRPIRGVRGDADIQVPAAAVNAALTAVVSAEASLARRVTMPIGSSLLVVARKRYP
jgi:SAM-dependent methyltransferase